MIQDFKASDMFLTLDSEHKTKNLYVEVFQLLVVFNGTKSMIHIQ